MIVLRLFFGSRRTGLSRRSTGPFGQLANHSSSWAILGTRLVHDMLARNADDNDEDSYSIHLWHCAGEPSVHQWVRETDEEHDEAVSQSGWSETAGIHARGHFASGQDDFHLWPRRDREGRQDASGFRNSGDEHFRRPQTALPPRAQPSKMW